MPAISGTWEMVRRPLKVAKASHAACDASIVEFLIAAAPLCGRCSVRQLLRLIAWSAPRRCAGEDLRAVCRGAPAPSWAVWTALRTERLPHRRRRRWSGAQGCEHRAVLPGREPGQQRARSELLQLA